jgi:Na+/melibiose symporter-like transporter
VDLLIALVTTGAAVTLIYLSWRHARGWSRVAAVAGWLLVCVAAIWWVRFRGPEHGLAYAAIALTFGAWAVVALAGRETPRSARPGERQRRLPRAAGAMAGRAAIARTLGRVFVAFPLAGAASLLASVLIAAGLPWGTVNRYVFAIMVAPIIWGVLAMWAGMTERLPRTAILLTGASAACAALLFVH